VWLKLQRDHHRLLLVGIRAEEVQLQTDWEKLGVDQTNLRFAVAAADLRMKTSTKVCIESE
jgi:hypothetical protein